MTIMMMVMWQWRLRGDGGCDDDDDDDDGGVGGGDDGDSKEPKLSAIVTKHCLKLISMQYFTYVTIFTILRQPPSRT